VKDGTTPTMRRATSPAPRPAKAAKSAKDSAKAHAPAQPTGELIEFPFPLQNGEMAALHLPKRLRKDDAERLNLFLRSLQSEPQAQIPEHTGTDEMAA
jgi:hypothetical protein